MEGLDFDQLAPMCKGDLKTADHILSHCPIARSLGKLALSCFGFNLVFPCSVSRHLLVWEGFFGRKVKYEVF